MLKDPCLLLKLKKMGVKKKETPRYLKFNISLLQSQRTTRVHFILSFPG